MVELVENAMATPLKANHVIIRGDHVKTKWPRVEVHTDDWRIPMQLEDVCCYICNTKQAQTWAKEHRYKMVKCSNCGLVYLNPRPSPIDIDEACRTGMHRSEKGDMNTIGRYSRRKFDDFVLKVSELFPHEELRLKPCRWLDIGAGYGEFIQALTTLTATGSELLGIEPCAPKVKKAQSLRIPVRSSALSDLQVKYTHVSLINVVSHLPNPIEFLFNIKPLMEPGCQLVLVTGNGGDIARGEFPGSLYLPDHLSFLGEGHLKTILARTGFHIKRINRHRAELVNDNYFVGLLNNLARFALGRPVVPLRISESSSFRSLWVRAELFI